MDVSDQEIKEMLDRLRQERAVRDARNDAYLQNNPKRSMLVQLGDSIDKFLTGQYAGDPGPYQATRNFGPGYKKAELEAGKKAEEFRPGAGFPSQQAAPIVSDDANTGDSEYRRMAQQYGDAELKNALLNQAGDGVNLADYYGAQRQLGEMVSGDSDNGEAMVQYFMTRPGFDTRDKAEAFITQNPGIAFREFNKANPMAMVGDKPAMIEQEAITDYMDTGLDRAEAIRRIRGGMPAQQESNIEQTAEAQPVDQQRQLNLDEIQAYMDSGVPGLNGKKTLGNAMQKIALTPTQRRNDPFLQN